MPDDSILTANARLGPGPLEVIVYQLFGKQVPLRHVVGFCVGCVAATVSIPFAVLLTTPWLEQPLWLVPAVAAVALCPFGPLLALTVTKVVYRGDIRAVLWRGKTVSLVDDPPRELPLDLVYEALGEASAARTTPSDRGHAALSRFLTGEDAVGTLSPCEPATGALEEAQRVATEPGHGR
jgi:hypothetical protein